MLSGCVWGSRGGVVVGNQKCSGGVNGMDIRSPRIADLFAYLFADLPMALMTLLACCTLLIGDGVLPKLLNR